MSKIISLLAVSLAAAFLFTGTCRAAQITDMQVFTEDDYVRVAVSLDQPVKASVEINAAEKLIFVRFDEVGIDKLTDQSFLYDNNHHLESVTFLPLGAQTTVVRVKARHPFKAKTYEIKNPPRFILELSEQNGSSRPGGGISSLDKGYYARGVSQMQKGSYNSALISFRNAIRSGNRLADSYYQAGLIRHKLGQNDKALINFSHAQKSSSFGDEARLFISWIHYKNGDYKSLGQSLENFMANLPDQSERMSLITAHPEIDYRALEAAAKGRLNTLAVKVASSGAIESVAGGSDREAATVYFAKGLVAKEEGRLEEAARFLEEAISVDDSYTEAHFQLGVVYKAMGKNKLSVRHFEKSLGSAGGLRKKSGGPVKIEERPSADMNRQQVPDVQPAEEGAAREDSGDDREDSALAGLISSEGGSGGADKMQPGDSWASREQTTLLASLRQAVANVIALPKVDLLRRQVKILTIILGVLFLLAVVGERVVLYKFGKPRLVVPNFMVKDDNRNKSGSGSQNTAAARAQASNIEKKRQMEVVLARELVAKKRANQPAVEAGQGPLELYLQPVGERGVYGADIAKRIKQELSRKDQPEVFDSLSPFAGRQDDLQTRLIRQLRSKNWTISDIAQEMNLSRDEIKWALAGGSPVGETQAAGKASGKTLDSPYGQARTLLEGRKEHYQGIAPKSMDREVDLELEINV